MDSVQTFVDFLQSISILGAAWVALYGIDAWRREHIGKRRMELAEEVLALFYQARDAIASIRSSFGYSGEGESRKPGPQETEEQKAALDRAYVLIERYNRHTELFSRLHSMRYRFMAQFGTEAAEPFLAIVRIVNEMLLSAQRLARLTSVAEWSLQTDEAQELHGKRIMEVYRTYYEGFDDDPIAPRVEEAVLQIERTCRAAIESQGTLHGLINARIAWRRGHGPRP
jgi:hypothetical protein